MRRCFSVMQSHKAGADNRVKSVSYIGVWRFAHPNLTQAASRGRFFGRLPLCNALPSSINIVPAGPVIGFPVNMRAVVVQSLK